MGCAKGDCISFSSLKNRLSFRLFASVVKPKYSLCTHISIKNFEYQTSNTNDLDMPKKRQRVLAPDFTSIQGYIVIRCVGFCWRYA